jgi:hypothetical protein
MKADMIYNGKTIEWRGRHYKATSGQETFQNEKFQCIPEKGPLPEGFYKLFLNDMGEAKDDGTNSCNLSPAWGMQTIPRGAKAGRCEVYWANWGFNRARLEAADSATKGRCKDVVRSGFYLHDSTKGFSHGCIEVEGTLFLKLKEHSKTTKSYSLILEIKYSKGGSTYGDTKI